MEQNHNMLRGISENGGIVFYGVDSTEIVREMERLHKTSAVTTAALGRLLTAASMMGIMLKSTQDSVTLQIKGGGPTGRLLAVSDGTGNVKGYVEHPVVELPPRADGHLNVGAAVGKDGTLDVIRDLGMREPYIGQVPLTSGEIAAEIYTAQKDTGERVSHIVLMGIGEPLDNLDNVLRFLELVNHPDGLNIGMRHISLSTCGVIPGIDRLSDLELQLTLSVSLHAPDSETRSKIMPVNRAYDVEKLFDACHRYFKKTGRRISFEYAMIDGINDHDWQADLIAKKLKGMPGHVNLIPLNDVAESPLKPSRRVAAFQKRLESHGLTATVRRSLGGDIDASCGQLRRKEMEERKKGAAES